jgi:glycosyltransferase involved in cell wall biosynthesis
MISGFYTRASGLNNVVDELSNFLAKNDVKVTIFNMYHRDFTKEFQNYKIEAIRPYNILPDILKFSYYEAYAYSLRVWRRIKHSDRFNLIHGHDGHCFFPALLRKDIPFVMTFHGLKKAFHYKAYGPNALTLKNPRNFTLFYSEKIAAKNCDVAIAPSMAVKEELINLYDIDSKKIKVIYNGVNTNRFRPINKKFARKILGLPKKKKYVIWVGNNPVIKRLSLAIKAVDELKNIYLLIVGVSGSNFKNVIFYGEVQDCRRLLFLYNAADILLFPSIYEGFPLVPLEAMSCGLPIIISGKCPTVEIIRNGAEGYIINDDDPKSYTRAIKSLLDDRVLYQTISLNCRKLAERYSWESQGKEYLKIYKQMANRNRQ